MAAIQNPLSQLPSRITPTFTRPVRSAQPSFTRGGLQYMSKHFAHPEGLPLMLSLGVGTVGCYLGLEAMNKRTAPAAAEPETRPWSLKSYRLGLTEKSVDEVLFSVGM